MTAPATRERRGSIMTLVVAAGMSLALLGLAAVAILPARPPSAALSQLLVMHNTMIAGRRQLDHPVALPRDESPVILEQEASGVLEGRLIESWVYRLEREAFTIHRLEDEDLVPRSASHLPLGDRRVAFFEIEDLQALAWSPQSGKMIVVLGAGTLATQLRLARWVDANPPSMLGHQ